MNRANLCARFSRRAAGATLMLRGSRRRARGRRLRHGFGRGHTLFVKLN